jgi:hypothetical protein
MHWLFGLGNVKTKELMLDLTNHSSIFGQLINSLKEI